jgi:hypothetical protein
MKGRTDLCVAGAMAQICIRAAHWLNRPGRFARQKSPEFPTDSAKNRDPRGADKPGDEHRRTLK